MQGAQPKGHVGVPRPTSIQLDVKPEPNSHSGVPRSALDHPDTISTSATNIFRLGNAYLFFQSDYVFPLNSRPFRAQSCKRN